MKLHQMKREKADSHDHVGNQSTSVTLRDKIIHSPKMMPHPFKRRDTIKKMQNLKLVWQAFFVFCLILIDIFL